MLIILDALRDEKLHGYTLAEKIARIYGIEKPSSGLIYPLLSRLDSLDEKRKDRISMALRDCSRKIKLVLEFGDWRNGSDPL